MSENKINNCKKECKITKEFYINNRKRYYEKISNNSITVLNSGVVYNMSADEGYDFDVDKNFYYLTGINQADVNLILVKKDNDVTEYLFIEKNDPIKIKWVGAKLYPEEAKEISGIDNIVFSNKFNDMLEEIINNKDSNIDKMYLNLELDKSFKYCHNHLFSSKIEEKYPKLQVIDAYSIIVGLRAIKTKEEVQKIQEAIDCTQKGIEKLMTESRSGIYEYQLENHFDFVIKEDGQRIHSFKTIAASGKNATILHYSSNNTLLKENELILFDLGTETDYYISDITRTFPINGKFTERQKQVYSEVLNVNKKCIEFLKPGITKIQYNEYAKKLLTEACYRLGLIKEDSEVIKYYFHSIGHTIGLDTHDPCFYENGIEEGMCLTVEPGLYIEEENIGIRIEDDVLITKDGCINLSANIIKEVDDIEDFFKKNNKYYK